MIRIAITQAAFEVAANLPLGSVSYEAGFCPNAGLQIGPLRLRGARADASYSTVGVGHQLSFRLIQDDQFVAKGVAYSRTTANRYVECGQNRLAPKRLRKPRRRRRPICPSQVRYEGVLPARRPSQENRNPQPHRCATAVGDLAYPDKTRSPRRDRQREANGYRAFEIEVSQVTCAKALDQLS
jgi:hypothetical protein